jgi:DNA-binding GntR family transcriptional regulator
MSSQTAICHVLASIRRGRVKESFILLLQRTRLCSSDFPVNDRNGVCDALLDSPGADIALEDYCNISIVKTVCEKLAKRLFSMARHLKGRTKPSLQGLPERAYRTIREQILQGRFALGAAISRRRLAVELGMSIVPVSEAFQRLAQEGLIESKPQVGTRIRIPTEANIRDRFVIREALESQSARLFAERAGMAERRELRELAEKLDALYRERYAHPDDSSLIFPLNSQHLRLHMRISECSGSVGLCRLIEAHDVLFYNWLFDLVDEQPPVPPDFHSVLIAAISGTDQAAADAAMRAHVRYNLEATIQSMRKISAQTESSWRLGRKGSATQPKSVSIRARQKAFSSPSR